MTRTFTKQPVWTWVCDECGKEHSLARSQSGLKTPDEMRALGWFIPRTWGDLCPDCRAALGLSAPSKESDHG